MKKILFLCIILLAILIGAGAASFATKHTTSVLSLPAGQTVHTVSSSPVPLQIDIPQRLIIPKIGVDAAVEHVGLDAQGRMDIPQNYVDVAWYDLGPRPGLPGSAVIDGHFDTPTGAPGVFWYLKTLRPADTIQVMDDKQKTYTFLVTEVTSYPFDAFPLQQVFAKTDKKRLNLITCAGTWDQSSHNYSNREVVYAVEQD